MRALTVTHAFGTYAPGDQITDKADVKAALASNPGYVVAINLPKPDADVGADSQKKPAKADDGKAAASAGSGDPSPSPAS
jgi:hypothetical protein